jgi:hypothetical protein
VSEPAPHTLALSEQDGVLTVLLSRPHARNAMTLEMVQELSSVLVQAEARDDLRVVALRGAGGHFCAGGDLKDLLGARGESVRDRRDRVADTIAAFGRLCVTFARLSLPTVCVLEGSVLGGGVGLACAADFVLADDIRHEVEHLHYRFEAGVRHSTQVDFHIFRAGLKRELAKAGIDIGKPPLGKKGKYRAERVDFAVGPSRSG